MILVRFLQSLDRRQSVTIISKISGEDVIACKVDDLLEGDREDLLFSPIANSFVYEKSLHIYVYLKKEGVKNE